MGVPTFYRWLTIKYPSIVSDVRENRCAQREAQYGSGEQQSCIDVEFDNLYIDMNGIIHPCSHPEDGVPPSSEEEMFRRTFEYVDRIVSIIKPKNLLYLAIDGVAPRAKMNQQRARRFKSAADVDQENKDYEELKLKFEAEGRSYPVKKEYWDSNVITPGTAFLCNLSKALYGHVSDRVVSHPLWMDLNVIISDANCPGEGEHKIMHFIRTQRTFENYNPNLRHCIHGADADLIMLGLVTHEAHFYILREAVMDKNATQGCFLCGRKTHLAAECPFNVDDTHEPLEVDFKASWKPLQLLSIPILREYLSQEFSFKDHQSFHPDIERCVDDFVLMCFFVGNDFLPHLPSLSIHKGSIDQMILLYQKLRPTLSGYLTDSGNLNMREMETFVYYLGAVEREVFLSDLKWKKRNQNRRDVEAHDTKHSSTDEVTTDSHAEGAQRGKRIHHNSTTGSQPETLSSSHVENIDLFKSLMRDKKKATNEIENPVDNVQLGVGDNDVYKLRYYKQKFHIQCDSIETLTPFIEKVAKYYVEGLRWVLAYYYKGVCSWGWFFPFHYAPFASEISAYGTKDQMPFTKGKPFKPFEQLMAVLPAQSRGCLPKAYADVMVDGNSPLVDFYPVQFKDDPNGKRFKWQWVVLLPFIDEKRLLNATAALENRLTKEEKERNTEGSDCLIISKQKLMQNNLNAVLDSSLTPVATYLKYRDFAAVNGDMSKRCIDFSKLSEWCSSTDPDVVCLNFQCTPRYAHQCRLLPNASVPPPYLRERPTGTEGDHKGNRFNAQSARRMIIGCLGRLGLVSDQEVHSFMYSSQPGRDRHPLPACDNRYEREMFPRRASHFSRHYSDHTSTNIPVTTMRLASHHMQYAPYRSNHKMHSDDRFPHYDSGLQPFEESTESPTLFQEGRPSLHYNHSSTYYENEAIDLRPIPRNAFQRHSSSIIRPHYQSRNPHSGYPPTHVHSRHPFVNGEQRRPSTFIHSRHPSTAIRFPKMILTRPPPNSFVGAVHDSQAPYNESRSAEDQNTAMKRIRRPETNSSGNQPPWRRCPSYNNAIHKGFD